jgi:DNA repair protein RadC
LIVTNKPKKCKKVQNNLNELGKLSFEDLAKFNGIGEAKAVSIIAALELGRRRRLEEAEEKIKIDSSRAIFNLMQPLIGELSHEEFWVIYLNNSNKVINKEQLSKGGITGTLVDVRLVFKRALELNATAVILSHNHPSGKLEPSRADKEITKKMLDAGNHLDIKVLDHIIVTEESYYSFADHDIL